MKTLFRRPFVRVLSVALLGALLSSVEPAQSQIAADWALPTGNVQGTRYSALTNITSANVGNLTEEFSYPTYASGSHQGGPLVVNGIMYYVTPWPNRLLAIDLKTPGSIGKLLWYFSPNPEAFAKALTCCDIVNRGAAYAVTSNGVPVVVYTLLDGNVVAVDAMKGTPVWRVKVADPWTGETLNTPVLIAKNKVIFGSSGAEMGVRGSVRALDLDTGRLIWRAYATGPDVDVLISHDTTTVLKNLNNLPPPYVTKPYYTKDQGVDLGITTWPTSSDITQAGKTPWTLGGGTSWAWITSDASNNLIFYGTSQPGTFNSAQRDFVNTSSGHAANKWGASIFARDIDTGVAKWVYQVTPWDNWDWDAVNEDTVVDLKASPSDSQTIPVIVHFDKNGFAYIINRLTGQLLSANNYGSHTDSVNWAANVNLITGLPSVNASKYTPEGVLTSNICPSAFGLKDWEGSAYSPITNFFYFGAFNMCMNYQALKVNYIAGTPFVGVDISIFPHLTNGAMDANWGEFVAYNPTSGRVWTIPESKPIFGGALATAGGVVFYGTLDKHFKAVKADTGAVLLDVTLECGIASAPITFQGGDGTQRVAVVTGLGYLNGGFSGTGSCDATTSTFTKGTATRSYNAPAPPWGGTPTAGGWIHVFKLGP